MKIKDNWSAIISADKFLDEKNIDEGFEVYQSVKKFSKLNENISTPRKAFENQ